MATLPRSLRRPGVAIPLAAAVAGTAGLIGYWSRPPAPPAKPHVAAAPPAAALAVKPEPLLFRPIAPADAEKVNDAVPVSRLPNPAAKPFTLPAVGDRDADRSLECLAQAVYYEAASEGRDGQRAVAQVVLNRLRHPAYPKSVCGVVYQGSERRTGCQFTFTCDGSLRRSPSPAGWARSREVAAAALAGAVFAPVGYATHYHTRSVVPYWRASLVKLATIGAHIFYRWSGGAGSPGAFVGRYAGSEPGILAPATGEPEQQAERLDIPDDVPPARVNRGSRAMIPVEAPLIAAAAPASIAPAEIDMVAPAAATGRRRPGQSDEAPTVIVEAEPAG